MSVTIRDVARVAGVSASTVSRVLNKKGTISDETTKRIYEVMKELNYVPNDFARSFATGSPRTFALVINVVDSSAYSNSFFNDTVFGIETTAHKNNYNLIITNGSSVYGNKHSVEKLVLGKKIDGIIFPISMVNSAFIKKLERMAFPCVILGHPKETALDAQTSWVDINNTQAGLLATRHLIEKGYRRIAFLSDGDQESFNQDRISGYCRELSANGLAVDTSLIAHGINSMEAGQEGMRTLLTRDCPPDAVICSSDRLALGALRTAQSAGLRIPNEFGIAL